MDDLVKHISKSFVAGIVALLPVGGTLLTLWWLEDSLAGIWLAEQPWYFPGAGILAALLMIYLVGVAVTSLVGRLVWRLVDRLLEEFPALGTFYRTLKQVLGYGEGEDALFDRVVLVPGREEGSHEVGLVTSTLPAEGPFGPRLAVFVPAAPTPTSGRLVLIEESATTALPVSVHDALKFLVGMGTLEVETIS